MRLAILLALLGLQLATPLTLRSAAAPATSAFATLSRRLPLRRRQKTLERQARVSAQHTKLFVDPWMRLDVLPSLADHFNKKPQDFRVVEKAVHEAVAKLRSDATAKRELGVLKFVDVVTNAQISRRGGKVIVRFAAIFAKRGLRRGVVEREVAAEATVDGSSVVVAKLSVPTDGWGTVEVV